MKKLPIAELVEIQAFLVVSFLFVQKLYPYVLQLELITRFSNITICFCKSFSRKTFNDFSNTLQKF